MKKRERIFHMLDGRCFYCGCKLDIKNFHLDYFKAKVKGGNRENNLVPACPDCNLFKSDLDIEEFRSKIASLPVSSYNGRMVKKYFDVHDANPVVFYYEQRIASNSQLRINHMNQVI